MAIKHTAVSYYGMNYVEHAEKDFQEIVSRCSCGFIEVPQHLYDKVAYRGGTEGVIAELHCKEMNLEALQRGLDCVQG